MIISHSFGIGIEEYEVLGKGNDFPLFDRCPSCNCIAHGNLHRNGYYWRYGISTDVVLYLPICRLKCLTCKVNISILPDFLIPYFQHTLHTIVERVRSYLEGKRNAEDRQQLSQVIKRFYYRLHWVHSFFVDFGHQKGLTKDKNKEALKYVKMIQDFGESTFLRRSWGHLSSYFMGTLILPYLSQ